MPFTTETANKIINKILRNTDFVHPSAIYVSLHEGDPGQAGANEVIGGGYGRKLANFSAAANKTTSNTADIEFPDMPTATITHVGLWSAASGGNFWWGGSLTVSKALTTGDTLKIPAGDLNVTLT